MSKIAQKWGARILSLRQKITPPTLVEASSVLLVFIGVSHFSQALAFIVVGAFGVWLTESGNS